MPTVSIITPSYNCEDFLEETIQSVIQQTFQDWELIIVDDHSPDSSYALAQEFSKKDPRIIAIRLPENGGAAVARNTAIERANGRYIAFLDSDDLWKENKLERQIKFMQDNGYEFTFTNYDVHSLLDKSIKEKRIEQKKLSYKELLHANRIGCLTAMYDTRRIGKIFMPLIRKRQDYALWLKILKQVEYAHLLPKSLAIYRVRNDSISSKKIDLIKYNWKLFRDIEKLSIFKSTYYLSQNIKNKLTS